MSLIIAKTFLGGGPLIDVNAGTYTPTGAVDGGVKYEVDGDFMARTGATTTYVDNGDWCAPKIKAPGAGYEIRATLDAGTLKSGTTGSWLALTSDRTWTVDQYNTADLTVDIRRNGGSILSTGAVLIKGGSSAYAGDSETVTVGRDDPSFPLQWGYWQFFYGSINDGTLNIYGPSADTVTRIYWSTGTNFLTLNMSSTSTITNSTWSTVTIAGTTFNRTAASYSGGGSSAQWVWSSVTTNPFGFSVGASKSVVFA